MYKHGKNRIIIIIQLVFVSLISNITYGVELLIEKSKEIHYKMGA
jgi:hypothetical protein